jgi:hypothetical protein
VKNKNKFSAVFATLRDSNSNDSVASGEEGGMFRNSYFDNYVRLG